MTRDTRRMWDVEAETFDEAADHGLSDPKVKRAWRELLLPAMGGPARRVVDLGCGTGTLSVLLATAGHHVTGVDFSAEMVRRARLKADRAGVDVGFAVADAAAPPLPPRSVDVVLSRHVLWAMPDPAAALSSWCGLLADRGRLVLIEGYWSTGAGLAARATVELVERTGRQATLRRLDDSIFWGRPIEDERYLVVGEELES